LPLIAAFFWSALTFFAGSLVIAFSVCFSTAAGFLGITAAFLSLVAFDGFYFAIVKSVFCSRV
jgi:hypothetical protein